MNYFIIPGNPPAAHFYELWQKEILAAHSAAKVRVSPYPKLVKSSDSEKVMNNVSAFHLEKLLAFHQETKSPITVLGHSLGGYIGLKILHEEKNDFIHRLVLLHPFLRKPEKSGQLILKAAAFLEPLKSIFIKNRKFLEYLSSDLTHVTDEEIENSFHIAKHESVVVGTDQSPIHIHPEKRGKVSVFYNTKDTWCPAGVIAGLRGQVKLSECSEPHDFVTSQNHRQSLFEKIIAG